jgi:hypothetical protein
LKPLPKGEYYEMFLTRNGKRAASCGAFRISDGDSIRLNTPFSLRNVGWIVTRERSGSSRHPVVLRS